MKNNKKRMLVVLLAGCMTMTTGFLSYAADTGVQAIPVSSINNKGIAVASLQEAWESIPEAAAVAVQTQEWYGKALADTDGEADVLAEAQDGSQVTGKIYSDTLISVTEPGESFTKITAGQVSGYVRNELLITGSAAVERANTICPDGAKDNAKTMEQIAAEEEAARAAAEAAAQAEAARIAAEQASARERELLAALIFCEAGNQPYDGQVGVGAVVMNRVRSDIFPGTIEEVIYQSGQFGPAITGKLDRILASGGYTDSCMQAAADALAGANPIGDALYFGNGNYGQLIGDHYFH